MSEGVCLKQELCTMWLTETFTDPEQYVYETWYDTDSLAGRFVTTCDLGDVISVTAERRV